MRVKKAADVFCHKDYKATPSIYLHSVRIGKATESENHKAIFVNHGKVTRDKPAHLVKNTRTATRGYERETVDHKDNASPWTDKNVLGKNAF